MARRKLTAGPMAMEAAGASADVARYRREVRGDWCPESAAGWLADRMAWRASHPGQPLPPMSSLDRARLMRYRASGQLDAALYRQGV